MKKGKIRLNGVVKGSRDLLLEIWDSLYISVTVEVRNFKFGMQIDRVGSNEKNAKLGQRGREGVT